MGEIVKTSIGYCKKCKYSKAFSGPDPFCDYLAMRKKRRGCEVGECDKFEARGRNTK